MARILILHAEAHGKGHRSAARAIGAAAERRAAGHEVRVEDALDFGSAFYRALYAAFYRELSENLPALWEHVYRASDSEDSSFLNHLRVLLDRIGVTELDTLIREYRPDVVICTHFLPLHILAWYRERGHVAVPLVAVVTDFTGHLYWVAEPVERYCVPSQRTAAMLADRGVARERLVETGIPVSPGLARREERDALRSERGLNGGTVVTVIASALEPDRVARIVGDLVRERWRGTLVVVPGRSPEIAAALESLEVRGEVELRVLDGFVDDLDRWTAASDLVVTKSGGLVVSETLAIGVPLVVVDPIGGQEEWNADHVVACGAGIQLRTAAMVSAAVVSLVGDQERLDLMRRRARHAGRRDAADRVVGHALEVVDDAART